MSSENRDLSEQAVSKLTEAGITSQLDDVESVDVDIRTDPLKLMQGQVDSVAVEGKGMVMEKDLRMEQMQLQTNKISVNPLSVAFGKIELTQPTNATAQVVLTEADINRAFNSNYIQEKLQNMQIQMDGKPVAIDVQRVSFQLPGSDQFALDADILNQETNQTQRVAFTAVPKVSSDHQKLLLENVEYSEGQGLSPELTEALLNQASELLNLQNFALEGMQLQLRQIQTASGKLTLLGDARIDRFPSADA